LSSSQTTQPSFFDSQVSSSFAQRFYHPKSSHSSNNAATTTTKYVNEDGEDNFSFGHQVSISQTFYEQLFHTKVFFAVFFYLQFGSVILWQNIISAKAAHKMLVKLIAGNVGVPHEQGGSVAPQRKGGDT